MGQVFDRARLAMRDVINKRNEVLARERKPPRFQVGDLVLLKVMITPPNQSPKFLRRYEGPHRILQKTSPVNFKIRSLKTGLVQIVHANRLKLYLDRPSHLALGAEEEVEEDQDTESKDQTGGVDVDGDATPPAWLIFEAENEENDLPPSPNQILERERGMTDPPEETSETHGEEEGTEIDDLERPSRLPFQRSPYPLRSRIQSDVNLSPPLLTPQGSGARGVRFDPNVQRHVYAVNTVTPPSNDVAMKLIDAFTLLTQQVSFS